MANATLADVDRALLLERLAKRDEPAYRADQVWRWAARGASGYAAMTNLPAELRGELERAVPFSTLENYVDDRFGFLRLTATPGSLQVEYVTVPRPQESWRAGPVDVADSFTLQLAH